MLAYIGLAMVTLVLQVFIHSRIKYTHNGSFAEYGGFLVFFSAIWPITLFLICIGMIFGLVKRG